MPKAGFIVHHKHLGNEYDLSPYELLICNAALDPDRIRAKTSPGCLLFGYLDLVFLLEPSNPEGYHYRDSWYQELEIAFDPSDFFSEKVREYRHLRPSLDMGARYAQFVANNMQRWDGVYWDHGNPSIPWWRLPRVMREVPTYWDIRFKAWRSYLFKLVNAQTHPNFYQISNTNAWDMDLDGACLEEGGGFDQLGREKLVKALGIYASQRHIQKEKTNRVLNVAWFWGQKLNLRGLALYGERIASAAPRAIATEAGRGGSIDGRRDDATPQDSRVPYIFGPQKSDN